MQEHRASAENCMGLMEPFMCTSVGADISSGSIWSLKSCQGCSVVHVKPPVSLCWVRTCLHLGRAKCYSCCYCSDCKGTSGWGRYCPETLGVVLFCPFTPLLKAQVTTSMLNFHEILVEKLFSFKFFLPNFPETFLYLKLIIGCSEASWWGGV